MICLYDLFELPFMQESSPVFRVFFAAGWIVAIAASLPGRPGLALAQDSASQPTSIPAAAPRPPQEVHWNLVELDGAPVAVSTAESQPYIYLQAQGDKLSGSGGCNRLFGSYDLNGNSLEFHSVAATQMACPGNAMDNEARLFEVLKLVTNFQIVDDVLSLRANDHVVAKFQPEKQK
jgi:heat shock protein HslJ